MIFCLRRFNLYLPLALLIILTLAQGCQSADHKRRTEVATLRVHLEVNFDPTDRTKEVPIYRKNPISIPIDRSPLLTELQVKEARVVEDSIGGYALRVEFDKRGSWLLEQVTTGNRGKRLPVFCTFMSPTADAAEGRWLAAPLISKRIADGVLVFTPDASIEEARQIAVGLNNAAKKYQ
jgi:preprotein translocase subunit SecD